MRVANEKGNKTAIYVRVSTTKESQKDSPEHQEAVCREKARQMELEVLEQFIYEDRDTGTTIVHRPAIQQLILDAKRGEFRNVIFASLSRFSRDSLDSLSLKRILVDTLGIRLISLDEGFDSLIDLDELKFQILSAVNQKLSEQISFSSRRGIRQSALKGNFIGSVAPYGYKKVMIDNKKTLIPDDQTKGIVQLIFQLYTAHKMGEKQIVKYLNEEKKIASPKGGVWGLSSVQRILQNEAYTGVNVFGKYESKLIYNNTEDLSDRTKKLVKRDQEKWERAIHPVTHEAIIDTELFKLAQEIRLQRGGGKRGGIRNNKNLFAGIIQCSHCGAAMVTLRSKGRQTHREGKEYRYLICSKRRRQGAAGCHNDYWLPYYPFKKDLLDIISDHVAQSSLAEDLFEKYKDLLNINNDDSGKQIQYAEKQLENQRKLLFKLRKEKMQGTLDEKQYEFEKQQYEADIFALEKRLEELRNNHEKKNNLNELYEEVMDSLDDLVTLNFDDEDEFEELRLIILKLIERITVDRKGNISVKTTFGPQWKDLAAQEDEAAGGKHSY